MFSLTEQVVLRLQQLVRRDTKKGFFKALLDGVPWFHVVRQLNTSEFIADCVQLHQLIGAP